MEAFANRLRRALTGDAGTPLVFLGNFEVEDRWARGEIGLSRLSFGAGGVIANRMEEFALLLGGADDHVVLKDEPDADYLGYLDELGFTLPRRLVAARQDPARIVTEDALADPALLAALGGLSGSGAALSAHGVSDLEERLAAKTGLALTAPSAVVCKAANSKIYSRRLADRLGVRQARGWTCPDLAALASAFDAARDLLGAGRRVVVKDAFGVSGKGIEVVADVRRLDRLHRMVARRAEKTGTDRIALVVEEWVAKTADLNYQFTVARDGGVHFDFVKEALTEDGVHKGHRMPARLSDRQVAELRDLAPRLGAALAADGYFGVVGVDAMVDPDGGLYPVVEINARNNMSTYQASVQEAFLGGGRTALARHYRLRLGRPLPFKDLRARLGDLLFDPARGSGLLVNNYATVNAAAPAEGEAPFDGRLYGIVVAGSSDSMAALDREIGDRLAAATAERTTHDDA
ncbi:ATP-grasp domain-containing protein [Actinomadura sp. 1N219]|uniref:preATP grasp domain-containing protein n=1 Tax=Actinomadura sp. 1N219 TaxID=3375152 RepID=UPI00379F9C84